MRFESLGPRRPVRTRRWLAGAWVPTLLVLGASVSRPPATAASPGAPIRVAQSAPARAGIRTVPEMDSEAPRAYPLSQHPIQPLDSAQALRLADAQGLRQSGRLDAAREALLALLAQSPHQPVVLGELARLYMGRQQWTAVERLARAERLATRDSILLGHELALTLERLSRPREVVPVVLEVWSASPTDGDWIEDTLGRLHDVDARWVRDPLRRVAEALPQRSDIVRLAARLALQDGDTEVALKLLAVGDAAGPSTPLRWSFAEELLRDASARDTSWAVECLIDLASDHARDPAYRLPAARRVWQVYAQRGAEREAVLRVYRALADLPPGAWSGDLLVGLVRGLRQAGYTAEVRALLDRLGDRRQAFPELALEGALNELREGPSARALAVLEAAAHGSPEGAFRYAEALFFAGLPDSAMRIYQLVTHDPKGPFTGAALERLFLLEDAEPREALPALGRMAYEEWRGGEKRSAAIAESLYLALPRGPLWAYAALVVAGHRDGVGDAKGALEPLLAVADSLPDDRLASVARQRAGDLYRLRLKDDANALAQYEECLSRYPKAWNAPEVRRAVQVLRRERRF